MRITEFLAVVALISLLSGCAVLHHVQVGDVDSAVVAKGQRFEVLVSETGVNLDEATDVAKIFTNNKEDEQLESIKNFIGLFQMGPVTGNPIYTSPTYADELVRAIHAKCPGGRISGLTSLRESNKYPVVSGEIIKIVGYCRGRG